MIKLISSFTVLLILMWFCGISLAAGSYEKALAKYKEGKFAEAIDLLTKKLSKDSGDCNLLGWAFLKLNNTDKAIKNFELSLSLKPLGSDSYCGLGYSYFQLGLFDRALKNFNKGIAQNRKNTDCLLGLGLTYERLQDTGKALDIFKKVLSIDKDNLFAIEKIEALSPQKTDTRQKDSTEFFATGNFFWVKQANKNATPLFIKGVNMSFALPGKFPTEFPEDEKLYLEWFRLVSEINANLIRVYTILPPQFYKAFKKYNHGKKDEEKLYLIQGIWAELPEKSNFREPTYLKEIEQEIKNALNVIYGNADLPHRYGHAYGVYRTDVSDYVLGYVFGREWEPPDVILFNKIRSEKSFNGKFLSIADANPMEVWLTEMLDYLISFETEKYKTQRPVAFMNWPPLDPLFHITEATLREEVEHRKKLGEIFKETDFSNAFDEDAVSLDETKIMTGRGYNSGIFASYHVYPYHPYFLRYEENYSKSFFPEGSNYYYGYLKELKNHYKDIPLIISEFGIPTSRGIAVFHPEGLHHGGHNETEQADILKKLMLSIKKSHCAGGIVFALIDEWFKSNWMARGTEERDELWYNAHDPEESYGLIAMKPLGTENKLMGKKEAWDTATLIYSKDSKLPLTVLEDSSDGARNIKSVLADYDAGYLYLRIDTAGEIDWENVAYIIAIDTYGKEEGDHRLPMNLRLESPVGFEFVILLHGKNSKLLIDDTYNRIVFDQGLLRFPGLSGYKENEKFKPVPNNNGLFTELLNISNRRTFSRDGRIFPETVYNASLLKQARLTDDTLSDFYYSKENNFIEIRLPWSLLYFSDPSQRQIIYSKKEKKITGGLGIMVVSYKPKSTEDSNAIELGDKTNITDILPKNLSEMQYYRWQGWESPKYIMRPKKAYYTMKEVYGETKIPESKIYLPPNFDYISVIKNHYNSLEKFIESYNISSPKSENLYGLALANLVYGLVRGDPFYILNAKSLFTTSSVIFSDAREKESSNLGFQYSQNILSGEYKKDFYIKDVFERVYIRKNKPLKNDFKKIIIGKSAIRLNKNAKIKTQVDRVTRDWLSAYGIKKAPWDFVKENTVSWHEGEKIQEIINFTDAKVYPVWGTKVKKIGDNWYAPDADGIFRFIISEDKVYGYPANIIIDERNVLLNDTHGINAIAWDSLGSDLAVGCGDLEGKVEAAYYLAENGVNVYMPTDRFLSALIGTNTKGVIIGSAPVKKTLDGAVIGDQPISIDVNEQMVVSNSNGGYPLQYYDTPYRYFKDLESYIGKKMNIIPVNITEYGEGSTVVEEAKKVGAKLIGIRVWGKKEHDSVYFWLKEDSSRRAILFHSAVYPEGYRLFFEFPQQTTFGDINVYFE